MNTWIVVGVQIQWWASRSNSLVRVPSLPEMIAFSHDERGWRQVASARRMRPVPGAEVWSAAWDFRLYRRQPKGRSVGVIKGVIRLRVSSILRSGSRHEARSATVPETARRRENIAKLCAVLMDCCGSTRHERGTADLAKSGYEDMSG